MIGDGWREQFPARWPQIDLEVWPNLPPGNITRHEFDMLRKEVKSLKKLLQEAKKFDESTGQKNCEMDDKIEFIKKIAKLVDVDLDEVFKEKK